jgi:hypothetical protein
MMHEMDELDLDRGARKVQPVAWVVWVMQWSDNNGRPDGRLYGEARPNSAGLEVDDRARSRYSQFIVLGV